MRKVQVESDEVGDVAIIRESLQHERDDITCNGDGRRASKNKFGFAGNNNSQAVDVFKLVHVFFPSSRQNGITDNCPRQDLLGELVEDTPAVHADAAIVACGRNPDVRHLASSLSEMREHQNSLSAS